VGGRTFASLRNHRNFRLYFFSHAVSFAGTWMQQIAAYWLVLELTGSPLAVGWLALAQLLPVTGPRARARKPGLMTAQGGTELAFTVAGMAAVLVAIAGSATLYVLKTPRIKGDWNADHA